MPKKKIVTHISQRHNRNQTVQTLYIPPPIEEKAKHPGMAMSVEEMAEELAIGRNVAYQLIKQPDFPSFMIGRRVLVNRKGLQDWIEAQCKKGLITLPGEEQ